MTMMPMCSSLPPPPRSLSLQEICLPYGKATSVPRRARRDPRVPQSLESPWHTTSPGAKRADIARHRDRAKLLLGGKVQPAGIEREGLEIQSRGDAAYDLHHEREAERLAHRIVQPKGESRMNRDIVAG